MRNITVMYAAGMLLFSFVFRTLGVGSCIHEKHFNCHKELYQKQLYVILKQKIMEAIGKKFCII